MRFPRLVLLMAALGVAACGEQPTAPDTPGAPVLNKPSMLLVGSGGSFTQVSAGGNDTCALKTDGSLACWGDDTDGQVSGPSAAGTGFTQVSAGGAHTCARKTDGSLACWGDDSFGQVSVPAAAGTGFTQVSAGTYLTCALKTDGSIACWGLLGFGQVSGPVPGAAGFTQVSAGDFYTCALKTDGSLACWGYNDFGQVSGPAAAGTGFTQVSAGAAHTCAVKTDGSLACWGHDLTGQVSGPAAAGTGFAQVSAGGDHTCALKSDGSLACWGYDGHGQVSGPAAAGTGFTQVSAGGNDTCALKTDGSLACWGDDSQGQVSDTPSPGTTVLPTATLTAPAMVDEGSGFPLSLTDAEVPGYMGAVTFTYAFDCGDGNGYGAFSSANSATCAAVPDNGTRMVKGTVKDQEGDSQEYTASVTVANVAPDLGTITPSTSDPIAVSSTAVSVSASFTDPGTLDTHTATIDWGDGSTSSGTVTETGGSGGMSGNHLYTTAGVYAVSITLSDDDSDSDTEVYEYVVVYDPSAGFVTGGGWIDSPENAYVQDPSLTGKAHFGFTSRYKKGKSTPDGSTEFQFKAGGMNFHSDVQDWLVVNQGGTNAQFKGSGTINDAGSYQFMIWASDGAPDTFRIKIWEDDGGVESVVYDNGVQQAISGGSIKIHAK